jgi:uncharacterized OsmC-like protein
MDTRSHEYFGARYEPERGTHGHRSDGGARACADDCSEGGGSGSSANGGELLFLALATCFCNDIYREAKRRGIDVEGVQVEVTGEFGGEGEGAREIRYSASVDANAPRDEVLALMQHTDTVAEIHKTLRGGAAVVLEGCEAREV